MSEKKSTPGSVSIWLAQTRANFLILAVLLVAIGLAFSYKYTGNFDWLHAILLVVGVVMTHISVNLFNEYSDYRTRIDFNTDRTPFSGGSGMLVAGHTSARGVLNAAIGTLLASLAIGVYFTVVSHWSLMIIILIGGFSILFYTDLLAKVTLGELFAGLALGTLVVMGTYIAMTARPGMAIGDLLPLEVILVSIPSGILTSLLLLINEFPDAEADKQGGRKHLVIRLGKKKAAYVYTAGIAATFLTILVLPLFDVSPFWIFLALIPVPFGVKASLTAINHGNNNQKLVPALGSNVITVLATDFLLAASILLALI